MELLSLIFFALALNIDAIGVGIAYGIRRIKLPLTSMLIICSVSMSAISLSMMAGQVIVRFIPPAFTQHIGGVILLGIGTFTIYQYYRQKKYCPLREEEKQPDVRPPEDQHSPKPVLQMKFLGLVIHVLKEPHLADIDVSGLISPKEALLLGVSLSMDALGAGIAISLLGYKIITTALCLGICQMISTYLGLSAGRGLSGSFLSRQIAVLPGLILIVLGMIKM